MESRVGSFWCRFSSGLEEGPADAVSHNMYVWCKDLFTTTINISRSEEKVLLCLEESHSHSVSARKSQSRSCGHKRWHFKACVQPSGPIHLFRHRRPWEGWNRSSFQSTALVIGWHFAEEGMRDTETIKWPWVGVTIAQVHNNAHFHPHVTQYTPQTGLAGSFTACPDLYR